jgi:alpha-mannosidase
MTNGSTTTLRILASAVPPVGYKVFRVENVAPTLLANAATFAGGVFQNARYRLTVNSRGAITSLVDPTRENREFAQTINGRAINDLGSSTGTLVVESAGPVSVTLLATAAAPLSHRTRITLFRDIDRIDIQNEILQNFNDTYTWAFSFNLSSPDVWHEEVGAVIRARLQANGGHYSPRNANYSWLTLNHFADMTGSTGHGITLSNADCYFMRLGNSTLDTLDTTTPQINVLAGGRVGGDGRFGIPNQGGDDYFLQRFALRTRASYDPVSAMRFALEHQNPLVAGSVIGTNPLYPESNYSFLTIDNPSVLLWALKPADDNSHVIARLWNLSGSAGNIGLTFPQHSVSDAQVTTHIETPLGNAAVNNGQLEEGIIGQQMRTFSLNLGTDGSACVPQNSAISDQELLVALQAVTDAPLSISLVVFTQTGMNIYANSSGMTGVALFNVRNAEGYITLELSSVITPTGAPAPTSLAQAISAHLPGIVVQALDTLLSARYGSNFNLESVQIHQNVMDVCVRT